MVFDWLFKWRATTTPSTNSGQDSDSTKKGSTWHPSMRIAATLRKARADSMPNPQARGQREVQAWMNDNGSEQALHRVLGARDSAEKDHRFRPISRVLRDQNSFLEDPRQSYDTPLMNIPRNIPRNIPAEGSLDQGLGLSTEILPAVVKQGRHEGSSELNEPALADIKPLYQVDPQSTAQGVQLGSSACAAPMPRVSSIRSSVESYDSRDSRAAISSAEVGFFLNPEENPACERPRIIALSGKAKGKLPERPYSLRREDATLGALEDHAYTVSQVPKGRGRLIPLLLGQGDHVLGLSPQQDKDDDGQRRPLKPSINITKEDWLGNLADGQFSYADKYPAVSMTEVHDEREEHESLEPPQPTTSRPLMVLPNQWTRAMVELPLESPSDSSSNNPESSESPSAGLTDTFHDRLRRVEQPLKILSDASSDASSDSSQDLSDISSSDDDSPTTQSQILEWSEAFKKLLQPEQPLSLQPPPRFQGPPWSFDSPRGRTELDFIRRGLCMASDTEPLRIQQFLRHNGSILRHLYVTTVAHPDLLSEEQEVHIAFGPGFAFQKQLIKTIGDIDWSDPKVRELVAIFSARPCEPTERAIMLYRKFRLGNLPSKLYRELCNSDDEFREEEQTRKEIVKRKRKARPYSLLRVVILSNDCVD
jgi:hypothetical protein